MHGMLSFVSACNHKLKKNCQQILRECVVYYVLMFRMQSCDTKIIKLTTLL